MSKFRSPITRILQWRSSIAAASESRLAVLEMQELGIARAIEDIDRTLHQVVTETKAAEGLDGRDLIVLAAHHAVVKARRAALIEKRAELNAQISRQREIVLRLRRDHRLVERLVATHRQTWLEEVAVSEEKLSAELYLAVREFDRKSKE